VVVAVFSDATQECCRRYEGDENMRHAMLAIGALLATGVAMTAGLSPAAAFDYPYCIQGKDFGVPGDCSYRSYTECMATASGRDAFCNINPRVAAVPPRRGWPNPNRND
jgi:Protein of unknown function (DUF3551)